MTPWSTRQETAASAACFLKCLTCGKICPAAHSEAYSQQILNPKINAPGCFLFLKGKQKPLVSRGKGEPCLDHHPGGILSTQFPLEIPKLCWLRPPILMVPQIPAILPSLAPLLHPISLSKGGLSQSQVVVVVVVGWSLNEEFAQIR